MALNREELKELWYFIGCPNTLSPREERRIRTLLKKRTKPQMRYLRDLYEGGEEFPKISLAKSLKYKSPYWWKAD